MKFNPLSNVGEQVSHCTIKDPVTGEICCKESDPDAPWAICANHGRLIAMRYAPQLLDEIRSKVAGLTPEYQRRVEMVQEIRQDLGVVYYVDFGDSIKIGTSVSLRDRLTSLRVSPDNVLATEPGSFELERQRHAEFKHLRIGTTEQFKVETDLLLHIKSVRDKHGDPAISKTVGPYSVEVTKRLTASA